MVHLEPTSAEWSHALHECVASRSFSLLHERTLLVFVDPCETFHPLHALLPRNLSAHAFVAILQLHEHAVALAHELQDASTQLDEQERVQVRHIVLESLVFAECAVDATSAKRALDASSSGHTVQALPFFCARKVNFCSGALCALAEDAARACAVLAQVTIALQTCAPPLDELDALESLTVVVEHSGGAYIAQRFTHGVVHSITRVKRRVLETSDSNNSSNNSNRTTLDAVLEAYERDFVHATELAGLNRRRQQLSQQQQLAVRVRAGYRIAPAQAAPQQSSNSRRNRLEATLLTSWHGIEHVQSLGAKPPPNASAVVCISAVDDAHQDGSLRSASVETTTNAPFAVRVQESIALITQLEQVRALMRLQESTGHRGGSTTDSTMLRMCYTVGCKRRSKRLAKRRTSVKTKRRSTNRRPCAPAVFA